MAESVRVVDMHSVVLSPKVHAVAQTFFVVSKMPRIKVDAGPRHGGLIIETIFLVHWMQRVYFDDLGANHGAKICSLSLSSPLILPGQM